MKQGKKLLALLLVMVMTFALWGGVLAYDVPAPVIRAAGDLPADLSGKVVILHSNDVHGQLDGYAKIAALRGVFEAKGAEVLLADCGDFSQGSPNVTLSKGAAGVEMMNAARYDVVTLGNHEFDFGYAQLTENLKQARFDVICADVLRDGKSILPGTKIFETKSGVKLGFFGMETPETMTKVHPALIQEISFLSNTEGKTALNDCAAASVKELRDGGADLVIGLFHLGVDDDSAPDGHRSVDVYAKTPGIDFVLDGHSHAVMTSGANGEPIQSTGTKFAYVGVVVIDAAGKKIEDHFLMSCEGMSEDPEVAAAAKKITDAVDAEYGAKFAVSEVTLNGAKSPNGNRDTQTNMGNLITDAIRWSVLKDSGAEYADRVVTVINGGGIRASIQPGDVTKKDINTVLPFFNTVAAVSVTGTELLEALEASTYSLPIGGYPQTEGISWTLDTTHSYLPRSETYPDSTYYGPASINRVSIESINGKEFDPNAEYIVITNDFCAAGGDTYYAFKSAKEKFDTGIVMSEAVISYITEVLGGVITAEKYGQPRGDQTTWRPAEVTPKELTIQIDGEPLTVHSMVLKDKNGYDTNYIRLRDIAYLMRGTDASFEVNWNGEDETIELKTNTAYTPIGGENEIQFTESVPYVTAPPTKLDGNEFSITSILLDKDGGGYTYYQLRDLGRILGFNVGWNEEIGNYIQSGIPYTDAD